jgi:putative transposase
MFWVFGFIVAPNPGLRFAPSGLHYWATPMGYMKWGNKMVLYRRNRVEGGTYFFTVTLQNRKSSVLVDWVDDLRECIRSVLREKPFHIDAWVVLPEHLHTV